MSDKIDLQLTFKQCELIALALDGLINSGNIKSHDRNELNELYLRFETLSSPEEARTIPKILRPQLVYDRDANIRPLIPR